jgi:hypothetical protein
MASPNPSHRRVEPTALLDLPEGAARSALRAGLMAIRVLPVPLPPAGPDRQALLATLGTGAPTVAFIDLVPDLAPDLAAPPRWLACLRELPDPALRSRTFLTRLGSGHVHSAERRWAQQLGFADVISDLQATEGTGSLAALLERTAGLLGLQGVDRGEIARYLRVLNSAPDARAPRALIRQRSGLGAEALALQLTKLLDVKDRRWRLREFAQCFVGREAVAALSQRFACTREEAVAVGQALVELGLVFHVAHEHPFRDEELFYRLAWSEELDDRVDLGLVHRTLLDEARVPVADRAWHGRTYAGCWVGEQAVAATAAAHGLSRLQASLVLQRLMNLGLFEHVVQERPLIDGEFFYRHVD